MIACWIEEYRSVLQSPRYNTVLLEFHSNTTRDPKRLCKSLVFTLRAACFTDANTDGLDVLLHQSRAKQPAIKSSKTPAPTAFIWKEK